MRVRTAVAAVLVALAAVSGGVALSWEADELGLAEDVAAVLVAPATAGPTGAPSASPAARQIQAVVAAPPAAPTAGAPAAALTAVPPPPPPPPPPDSEPVPSMATATAAGAMAPRPQPGPSPCDVGAAAGAAQVVVVRGESQRATVRACSRTGDGSYVTDLGPFTGWVGRSGVAAPGTKREGDGRTPAGVFPLRGGFGVRPDPGLVQGWFVVDGSDVWVDDPESSLYNTHQRAPADGRWTSAEQLHNPPAYDFAQVIGYNESRTPGAGSAIFLHVATGGPTAGCVSLPTEPLLRVLRWQRPDAVMVIS